MIILFVAALGSLGIDWVDKETFSESYTTIVDLSDGAYFQVQLAVSNIGPGSRHGGCRALYIPASGSPWTARDESDTWTASTTRLQMGPCELSLGPPWRVHGTLQDRDFEVRIFSDASRIDIPGYPLRVEKDFYESQVLIPRSRATLLFDHHSTPGFAYADHSRSTMLPKQLAAAWIRFRALTSDSCATLLLARYEPKSKASATAYLWQGRTMQDVTWIAPVPQTSTYKNGATLDVMLQSAEETRPLHFTLQRSLYEYAPLKERGLVGRALGAIVGQSVTTTYRATLDRDAACPSVPGILEITVNSG